LKLTTWNNCYDNQWSGLIVSEAFSHPAKFSPGLIQKIYSYGIEQGWFKPGDVIGDPFGGIGGGGIFAAYSRLQHVAVELEQKFVDLTKQNYELHRPAWEAHGYPVPVILQGDSRRFSEIVGKCAAILTSPPYEDQVIRKRDAGTHKPNKQGSMRNGNHSCDAYGQTPGQIGTLKAGDLKAIVTSPPFTQDQPCASQTKVRNQGYEVLKSPKKRYVPADPGNIGNLKMDSIVKKGLQNYNPCGKKIETQKNHKEGGKCQQIGVKNSEGKDGSLKDRIHLKEMGLSVLGADQQSGCTSIISNYQKKRGESGTIDQKTCKHCVKNVIPPSTQKKEKQENISANIAVKLSGLEAEMLLSADLKNVPGDISEKPQKHTAIENQEIDFVKNVGKLCKEEKGVNGIAQINVGTSPIIEQPENSITKKEQMTYWSEMAKIYKECWIALRPGGYLIVVLKSYIKNKRKVPLPMQTLKLLIHLGFEPIERIKAMLIKETVNQGLFGEDIISKKERKSFFRRLAEQKGSPRIDFEEILVVRK